MVVQFEVFTDIDVFEAYEEQIAKAPALMRGQLRRAVNRSRRRIRDTIQPPPPPSLPFVWSLDPAANARARRWYFANKVPKGSKGGRYKRTGALIDSIDVTTIRETKFTDLIELSSDAEGAAYVIGERQVPSHSASPWFRLDEIALGESEALTDELIELWFTVTDPFAGIPV